jgi:hypothetical protein
VEHRSGEPNRTGENKERKDDGDPRSVDSQSPQTPPQRAGGVADRCAWGGGRMRRARRDLGSGRRHAIMIGNSAGSFGSDLARHRGVARGGYDGSCAG